jgi:hypothetical protein
VPKAPLSGNYSPWMSVPPPTFGETELVACRLYTWCTKCHQGQGLWVCQHNTEIDGYSASRNQCRCLNSDNHDTQVPPPTQHAAQFSLIDYLDDYFPEDAAIDQQDDGTP